MSDKDKRYLVIEILTLVLFVGLLLPSLISAKDTILVLLGVALSCGAVCYFSGLLPYKSYLVKLIKSA